MNPKLRLCLALVLNGELFCGLAVAQAQTNSSLQPTPPDLRSVPTNDLAEHFDLISRQGFGDLEKRAATGDVEAQYQAGARYAEGEGVDESSIQAFTWLEKAAQQGDARAERRVGEMLIAGTGTATNVDAGLIWLNKAATQGDVYAQADLGVYYLHGEILPQDETKAFHWFLAAAQQGAPAPERSVGAMYFQGQGTTRNVEAGIEWLKRAAAQNEPQALYNLGVAYLHGDGEPKDAKLAFNYFLKSAIYGENEKRNETDAKATLGMFFVTGDGAPKNVRFGLRLLLSAAKDGNLGAQENLGKLFLIGHRYPRAFTWLNRAAHQGSESAEYLLGGMHLEGLAVPTNQVEALKWFYLAAMQGDPDAEELTGKMLAQLSPAVGNEAIAQAKAFKPVKEQPPPVDDSEVTICPLNRHFLVPVKMLGATKHLVVDTGSGLTVLDEKYREALGNPLGQDPFGGAFGTNINVSIYRSPDLSLGDRPVDDFWVLGSDFAKFSQKMDEPVDGILGMACLRDHLICFDPDRGTFRIGGSVPNWIKEDAQAIPLERVPDKINEFSVNARINGMATVHLMIDSGAMGAALSLREHDRRQIFRNGKSNLSTTNVGTLGNQVQKAKITTLQSLIIGTNVYTNLTVELVPGTKESSVGQEFIRKYVPAIDFPHRVLYLRPDHATEKP